MNREPGYYWCKLGDDWVVAEYLIGEFGYWNVPGLMLTKADAQFAEIDEKRIERQKTVVITISELSPFQNEFPMQYIDIAKVGKSAADIANQVLKVLESGAGV